MLKGCRFLYIATRLDSIERPVKDERTLKQMLKPFTRVLRAFLGGNCRLINYLLKNCMIYDWYFYESGFILCYQLQSSEVKSNHNENRSEIC